MRNLFLLNSNLYNLISYFFIYSFLGWLVEVGYAYMNQKKFVNRGFLHGPICPIYGTSILSMVLLLNNFNGNLFSLFIITTLITSTMEYFTGYLLEKIFKKKYWDYTDDPFNIHGRICIPFSIMWGTVSIGVIKIVHPIVSLVVNSFSINLLIFIIYSLFIFFILDLSSTLAKFINLKKININFQLDIGVLSHSYRSNNISKTLEEKIQILKSKILK